MARKHFKIYQSRKHLIATFVGIIVPLLFLLAFSDIAHVTVGHLVTDVSASVGRLFVAYVIATFLGWLGAVAFFRGRWSAIALPVFDVLQSFPTFAALPLATYAWGVSGLTVIIFLIFTIIWPIFFTVISGLRLIKHDWEEAVEIMGLTGWDYWKHFLLPVSIPGLITGSIVGLGDAWEAMVATEIIVGIKSGLGNFFQSFSRNPTVTVFGIFGFLLLIFSINKVIWLPLLEWSHRMMEE